MKYRILRSDQFRHWYQKLPSREQLQVAKRFSQIENEAYFGDHKSLEGDLWELKWANGRRIYYSLQGKCVVILLYGGNKNGQTQDINQARNILKKFFEQQ
jgi:putative addiction module killer protein